MKSYFKISILTTLAILMTASLAYAAVPPAKFGIPPQPTGPKECSPTAFAIEPNLAAFAGPPVGVASPALSVDGFISTGPTVITTFDSFTSTPANTWFQVGHVTIPGGAPTWNPNWVDIKINYAFTPASASPDGFAFQISFDNITWTNIKGNLFASATITEQNFQVSQVPRPGGGSWTWTDISNLQIRVFFSQNPANLGVWDGDTFNFYEAWIDGYSAPLPPTGPSISLQPGNITTTSGTGTGALLIYEVYANGFTKLWGYQFRIDFNQTVLKALSVWTYAPWVSQASADVLNNTKGFAHVSMQYFTFNGDPNGFTGNAPLARIYFQRLLPGTTLQFSPLNFNFTLGQTAMSDPTGTALTFTTFNGFYGTPPTVPEFPLGIGIVLLVAPAVVIAYLWRTRSKRRVD